MRFPSQIGLVAVLGGNFLCAGMALAQEQTYPNLPDVEFEAALPSLDAPPAAEAAFDPPEPGMAAEDAELQTPLTPLSAFEAIPPRETAADEESAPDEVRYSVDVTGLRLAGLYDEFENLSALLEGVGSPAPASQVRLRAEADALLIQRLLRSQGYYDGATQVVLDPATGRTERLGVTLAVTPGRRYALGDISITGSLPEPTKLARQALTVKSGDPIVALEIEAAEANVALRLPEQGYPFATIGPRDVVLDQATYLGDYTLPLESGPLSVFGAIQSNGEPFDASHVSLLARFGAGQRYDSTKVDDLRRALTATGLLSTVSIEPVRTGEITPGDAEVVDLRVSQTAAPPRSLAAAIGYGAGEGFRLSASWMHRNFFPPEGALGADFVLATEEQRLAAVFRRSNWRQRDRTLQVRAEIARERRNAYDAQSINLGASVSRVSTPLWQKRWTYSLGAELVASQEGRFADAANTNAEDSYYVVALPTQIGLDLTDALLDPTRGYRVSGWFSPEASQADGFTGYLRTLVEASAYRPVGERLVLAGRARVGSVVGIERDSLAPSRRLYAGGGGSVRGFGYQELGPRDQFNDPIGGLSLVEFSIEARYRLGNFGIVPFIDAGQVYESRSPGIDDIRVGVGVGARYYTPFGPLRVDVATPLNRREGESAIALYVSVGQAF